MSEWISVKDRLPKNGEFILVFTKNKDETNYEVAKFDNDFYGYEYILDVIYWMPLPEPPK